MKSFYFVIHLSDIILDGLMLLTISPSSLVAYVICGRFVNNLIFWS